MDGCHFDFKISESDFTLPEEKVKKCREDKLRKCRTEKHEEAEVEELEEEDFEEEEEEEEETEEQESQSVESQNQASGDSEKIQKIIYKSGFHACCQPPDEMLLDDNYYTGLKAREKHFRTEYPDELQLRKDCTAKPPGKWKTVDNYKTQPVARFSPVSSTVQLVKKKSSVKDASVDDAGAGDKEKEKPKYQKASRDPPPIVSVTDEIVVSYLEEKNIQMMMEYFLGLCILNTPEDPFQYIAELADKLIKGRESDEAFKQIPRLLSNTHVEAMFRLYDRVGSGFMSNTQYKNAMNSIGVVKYNETPAGHVDDEITKETFLTEANNAVDELLRSFLLKQTTRS